MNIPGGRIGALTLVAIHLAVAVAGARDIYVNNNTGNDHAEGLSEKAAGQAGPVRTLTRALEMAAPCDRIVLANTGQPYRESVSLVGARHSGDAFQPFVIEGNGATLDGKEPIPPAAWETYRSDIFRFRPRRKAHQMLYLDGVPAVFHPVTHANAPLPHLEPLEWTLYEGAIYFRIEGPRMIDDYPLAATNDPVGITLYRVHDVVIANLVVEGFQLDGVSVFDDVRDCLLIDLVCRGNGRSGIAVQNAARVRLEHCTSGDNGEAQLYLAGYSETRLNRSRLLDNTAPAIERDGGKLWVNGKLQGPIERP